MDIAILSGMAALLTGAASIGGYLLAKRQFEAGVKQTKIDTIAAEKAAEYQRMVELMGQYVTTLEQYRKDVDFVRNQLNLEREECEKKIEELKEDYEEKVQHLLAEVARISGVTKATNRERGTSK